MRYPLKKSARFEKWQETRASAQTLIVPAMDGGPVALMDEGWHEELVADEDLVRALDLGRRVVALTEQNAPPGPLVGELITQGIVLARLKSAEFVFKSAIMMAMRAGAQDKVALAALTMIAELDQLPLRTISDAFEMARDMPDSIGIDVLGRVADVAVKLLSGRWKPATTKSRKKIPSYR